jgi:hypothetical protein
MIDFWNKLTVFFVKNANCFAKIFSNNIFKIITSVPVSTSPTLNDRKMDESRLLSAVTATPNFLRITDPMMRRRQGCQMEYLHTKTPIWENLGIKNVGIFYIWPFGTFYEHLVYFMNIWFIF